MSDVKEGFDVCEWCCGWVHDMRGEPPSAVRDSYPRMMHMVLRERFGMPEGAARRFVSEACEGGWERMRETRMEKELDSEAWADALLDEVFYCSDRWGWDRVIRVQWLYKRMCERMRREGGCHEG